MQLASVAMEQLPAFPLALQWSARRASGSYDATLGASMEQSPAASLCCDEALGSSGWFPGVPMKHLAGGGDPLQHTGDGMSVALQHHRRATANGVGGKRWPTADARGAMPEMGVAFAAECGQVMWI